MASGSLARSNRPARKRWWFPPLWVGLLLVLVPSLLFIGIVIYQLLGNLSALRQGQNLVVHTLEVINTANGIKRNMQRAESNERGFLITGDPPISTPTRRRCRRLPTSLRS